MGMLAKTALKRAQKLFGKTAMVREEKGMLPKEEGLKIGATHQAAKEFYERVVVELEAFRKGLVRPVTLADHEILCSKIEYKNKAYSNMKRTRSFVNYDPKPFKVGEYWDAVIPMFSVRGEGISWEEALEKAEAAIADDKARYAALRASAK